MKPQATGTLSGCVVWIISFVILSACLLPTAMIVGTLTTTSNLAVQTVGPRICPAGTTADFYTYSTTTTDEFGNSQPSTAYELHCLDANGNVVSEDPVRYAFLWTGIVTLIGLVIAILLAFVLAAPTGLLIAKLLKRRQKSNVETNIEPI